MKKVKLIISAVAMFGLVSSSAAYADGFSPGEGLYIGAFVGAGTGIVQPKVSTTGGDAAGAASAPTVGGIFEATEGGLGLMGIEGGGWLGYGYKMGDLYAGLEGEMAGGDVEFKLNSSVAIDIHPTSGEAIDVTEVRATKDWTGGMFGRLGYYMNPDTLLSFKAGVLVSKFDVSYTGQSETFYGGGPSFGVNLESRVAAIDPNLSLRVGAVYTDFLTAAVSGIGEDLTARGGSTTAGSDTEITGSALSARIGLTYSFFDVNSLF